MPPIEKPTPDEKYDIVFIGGGSGGSAGSVSLTRHVCRVYANVSVPSAAPHFTVQRQLLLKKREYLVEPVSTSVSGDPSGNYHSLIHLLSTRLCAKEGGPTRTILNAWIFMRHS